MWVRVRCVCVCGTRARGVRCVGVWRVVRGCVGVGVGVGAGVGVGSCFCLLFFFVFVFFDFLKIF